VSDPVFELLDVMPVFGVLLSVGYRAVEAVEVGAGETYGLYLAVTARSVAASRGGFHCSYIITKDNHNMHISIYRHGGS
jgi:hypothetical protein